MTDNILKYENAHWTFPLLFECEAVWTTIYRTFDDYGIRLPKAYLYGAPETVWTGGRGSVVINKVPKEELTRILDYVYHNNAIPTFTFSRIQITPDDLKDEYANFLLDNSLEFDCNFIVYSDLLKDHIKSKKPNAKVISSVIKPYVEFQGATKNQEATFENETNYYNKLLKEYDIVVVRPEYSISKEFQQNPNVIDDLSRIEILLNQTCVIDCHKAYEHYKLIEGVPTKEIMEKCQNFACVREHLPPQVSLTNSLIHNEEQVRNLMKAGVKHLKVKGRSEFRYTYESIMLLLASQMFNFNGPGYFILRDCASGRLREEMDHFGRVILGRTPPEQKRP